MDATRTRGRRAFPTGRPMDALKADHQLARQLFDRYFHARNADEKKDAGTHIVLLLEMHTSLEEGIFYPRVRGVDPALVDRCEQDHEQVRRWMERLKIMDESDPQAEQLFRQVADAVLKHIDIEERQLFPKVQQAGLDMDEIWLEMQSLETRMIAARLQKPLAPGARQ